MVPKVLGLPDLGNVLDQFPRDHLERSFAGDLAEYALSHLTTHAVRKETHR
jgi:hypothetical protein